MKKKNWLIPIMTLTIAISAITVSYAAEGWAQDNGQWVYYNSSNTKLYDTWKKGADNKWRWINSSGNMETDAWVDDYDYYVDSSGIMLDTTWKQITTNNETKWYYFGDNGKKITSDWKKIDSKWYYFDDDGELLTGWILDDMYYCGSDGVMLTGWQKLYDPESSDKENSTSPGSDSLDDDEKDWYYFNTSNGKKYTPTLDSAEYGERKIDGKKYCFDKDGILQTGWVNIEDTDNSSAKITDFKYYNTDGTLRTGWYSLEPPDDLASNYDYDIEWFYFSSTGVPEASSDSDLNSSDIMKISGNSYLFNQYGNPVFGLKKVYIGTSTDEYTSYYFGTRSQCIMQKGKKTVEEGNGENNEFYFQNSGRGFTGVYNSYLYYYGKIQKAESGTKYQVISLPSGSGYINYVINTSGKLQKSCTSKDADGVKYTTSSSGVLTEVDGETVKSGATFNDPEEPDFD